MGMDTTLITFKVEDAFDIQLNEKECRSIRTVGELHALVADKLHLSGQGPCLSMKSFHLLRRHLMRACDLMREDIRRDSPLVSLLPVMERKAMWRRLESSMNLSLPALTLPTVVATMLLASTVGAMIAVPVGILSGMSFAAVLFTVLLLVAKEYAMHWLASPLANRFHIGIQTVGDLTSAVLRRNFGAIAKQARHAGDLEIWNTIRAIVAENLGIDENRITPEATFIEDLGAT